ncbi:MAG: hypothetical protein EBZ93_13735 [Actinobacteria bacterium]|nr:hypothetical protein [Actinomycetota bacterium]
MFPIEIGPLFRFHEVRGLGHGLSPELADELHKTRHQGGEAGEVPLLSVIPTEIEVTVGALQLG